MPPGDITHQKVDGILLTGSLATLYTVPGSPSRIIIGIEIMLLNVDTTTTYYPEIQFIPSGGSAATQYKVVNPQSAGGNGMLPGEQRTYAWNATHATGDFIQAREAGGNANKIAFRAGVTLKEI